MSDPGCYDEYISLIAVPELLGCLSWEREIPRICYVTQSHARRRTPLISTNSLYSISNGFHRRGGRREREEGVRGGTHERVSQRTRLPTRRATVASALSRYYLRRRARLFNGLYLCLPIQSYAN